MAEQSLHHTNNNNNKNIDPILKNDHEHHRINDIDLETNPIKEINKKQQQQNTKKEEIERNIKHKLEKEEEDINKQLMQAQKNVEDRFKMEGQLRAAKESLLKFLNPSIKIEEQIPKLLLADAKGIIFLTVMKGGMIVGGATGTGIIVCRLGYQKGWSGPCSIGLLGAQIGLNVGLQKTEFIIVLRDDNAVKTFMNKQQLKFGVDFSIAAGPLGRDANIALSMNEKSYAPIVSYSITKGIYIGFAFEAQGIEIRDECNKEFYNQLKKNQNENDIESKHILTGCITKDQIPHNQDYNEICEMLNNYIKDIELNKKKEENLQKQKLKNDDMNNMNMNTNMNTAKTK